MAYKFSDVSDIHLVHVHGHRQHSVATPPLLGDEMFCQRVDSLAAAWDLAIRHLQVLDQTGNCRGLIIIAVSPSGRTHLSYPGGRSTFCGLGLRTEADNLRASTPRITDQSGIDQMISCLKCRRAFGSQLI